MGRGPAWSAMMSMRVVAEVFGSHDCIHLHSREQHLVLAQRRKIYEP